MSKHVQPYTAQRITFTSAKSLDELKAALDKAVNRQSPIAYDALKDPSLTKEQYIDLITQKLGPSGFMFFEERTHAYAWVDKLANAITPSPRAIRYTLGNPLIAQTMLVHDRSAMLHVPPEICLQERKGGGSTITYDLRSASIALGGRPEDASGELLKASLDLDDKLEGLFREVIGDEPVPS
ncbi:hypothetical protein SISSUDRAFT_1132493 [Sistotremastrum suecicum HHB10207 ss-3]|uniref:DUF302 domain-containing protein n=1 Tax=Sistotremastrum suecicum HHB10207 ss-3 TaxID=1314776 RepID=A0A165YRD2_9AGAM|nr:hypothetical protein SISSUDRAFT_1132493 [Sistotremastrum suecicum HHB10207 ss-3]